MRKIGRFFRAILLTATVMAAASLSAFAQEETDALNADRETELTAEEMEEAEKTAEEMEEAVQKLVDAFTGKIAGENAEEAEEDSTGIGAGTYNMLLIGVDRRDDSWNGNSDVMILVTVNPQKETIYLTSFMRDLYANIEGIGVRKLNAACANGGAKLCVKTIRDNYQVRIDNYALVDFYDMIDIVDIFGGVDVELTEAEVTKANSIAKAMCKARGVDFEEHQITGSGLVHLDGYLAVGHMRNRSTGGDSDFGRTARQREVLLALLEKMQGKDLTDMAKLILEAQLNIEHDVDSATMLKLAAKLPSWLEYDVEQQRIPYDNLFYIQNEILTPNMDETIRILQETLYLERR